VCAGIWRQLFPEIERIAASILPATISSPNAHKQVSNKPFYIGALFAPAHCGGAAGLKRQSAAAAGARPHRRVDGCLPWLRSIAKAAVGRNRQQSA